VQILHLPVASLGEHSPDHADPDQSLRVSRVRHVQARLRELLREELIPAQTINEAYERMLKNDVRYRFVIDTSTL